MSRERNEEGDFPQETETNPAPGAEPGPEEPEGPQAGPREIAVAVLVLVIMVGGIFWAWFQGYQLGHELGGDQMKAEMLDDQFFRLRQARAEGAREAGALGEARFFIELVEGQRIQVVLENPDGSREEKEVEAGTGERVVISVAGTDTEMR